MQYIQLDEKERQAAIIFLQRTKIKGAEAPVMAKIMQKLQNPQIISKGGEEDAK